MPPTGGSAAPSPAAPGEKRDRGDGDGNPQERFHLALRVFEAAFAQEPVQVDVDFLG